MIYPKQRSQETLDLIRDALVYVEEYDPPVRHKNGLSISVTTNKEGYVVTKIPNEGYVQLSHIVWFLNTGVWPTLQVDHNDHNKKNNKFGNLQELTHAQNNGRRRHSWSRGDHYA